MANVLWFRRWSQVGLAVVCGGVLLGSTASAALLSYEPFEFGDVAVPSEGQYALGDEDAGTNLLGGQDPVLDPPGFYAGPWIQAGGDSQVVKGPGSLSYPNLPTVGGRVEETVQFDCCSFGRTGRELTEPLGLGRGARTIYQSFLIDFGTQGTDAATDFGKRGYEMWNGGVDDTFLAVDLFLNSFGGVNELSLAVTTVSGSETVPLAGNLSLDDLAGNHFVVLKFEFNPLDPDVVSVILDPTDSIEANWAPAASISVANSDLAITHHSAFTNFTFSGGGHVPGAIDEIRWGDTFADVTPFTIIPEPASLALVTMGLMGLAVSRRR